MKHDARQKIHNREHPFGSFHMLDDFTVLAASTTVIKSLVELQFLRLYLRLTLSWNLEYQC